MTSPFLDSFRSSGNAFLDSFGGESNARLGTATGRQSLTAENIQENISRLTELKKTAPPEQQAQLDRLIKELESQREGFTRPVEERGGSGYAKLGNLGRGVAAGVARGPVVLAELAATTPKLVGSGVADNLRNSLAERAQLIMETLDPEGVVGAVGEFAGEMPAQMLAFEGAARAIPGLKPWLNAPVAGGIVKRAAVSGAKNAVVATPFSLLQAAGLEGASVSDRVKQFALGQASAVALGAIIPARKAGEVPIRDAPKTVEVPVVGTAAAANREAELAALNAKAAADKAARAAKKQIERLARAEWTLANPEKSWNADLNKTQRTEIVKGFIERNPVGEKPLAPTTTSVEEQAATLASKEADLATAVNSPDVLATEQKALVAKQVTQLTEELKSIAQQFDDPAVQIEVKDQMLADFKFKIDKIKQLGGLTSGLEDAYVSMRRSVGQGPGGEKLPPINGETATPLVDSSPTLDKAPTAGLSPAVVAVKQRMDLRKAFDLAGIPWDDSKPTDVLMRQLNAAIQKTKTLAPPPEHLKTPPVAQKAVPIAELPPITLADIASPAVRDPKTGRVFAGLIHADAMITADKAGIKGTREAFEHGYVTKDGRFIDTPTGEALAAAADATLEHGPPGPGISHQSGTMGEGKEILSHQQKMAARIPTPSKPSAGTSPSPPSSSPPPAVAVVEQGLKIDVFYDKHQRIWTALLKDKDGNQIGGASYGPTKESATKAAQIDLDDKAQKIVSQTFLTGIPHKKPLESMSYGQLDKLETLLAEGIERVGGDDVLRKQLLDDIAVVQTFMKQVETSTPAPIRPLQHLTPDDLLVQRDVLEQKITDLADSLIPLKGDARAAAKADLADAKTRLAEVKTEIGTRKIEARQAPKTKLPQETVVIEEELPPLKPADFRRAPSKLGDADLARQIDDIHSRLSVLDPRDAEPWSKRLAKLMEEQTSRASKKQGPDDMPPIKPGGGPLLLQSHPSVTAFVGGYTYGLWTGDSDDPDYQSRALMWGLGSAGLVAGAKYLLARKEALRQSKISDIIDDLPKVVTSVDDLGGPKVGTLTRFRQFYQGMVRGTDGLERVPINKDLPTQKNPGKLAAMYGSYAARTERWLTTKVTYVDPVTGEPVPIVIDGKEVLPLQSVLKLAKDDKQALGNLAVAYASAEGAGKRFVPMDQVHRERLIRNAPDYLVEAVKELRRYNAAGLIVMNKTGRLSDEGLRLALSEQWYTPLHRVIKSMETLKINKPNFKGTPNALFARKGGSTLEVKNPYDVSVDMTAQMLRAAEYGNVVEQFIQRAEELPATVRQALIEPIGKQMNPKALEIERAVTELRKLTSISEADAKGMLTYMDSDAINETPGIITAWRDGEIHSYKVNSEIFKAIKSLSPVEIDMVWKVLGAPARFASKGVVYNPVFTAYQFVIDSWAAFMNSKYGFRLGLSSVEGWYNDFFGTKKYQKLLDVGGPTSLQSLKFLQGTENAIGAIQVTGPSPARTAWNNMKEGNLWEAYKAVILPVANAARVGEYLRALDHGASTLEAAYAAQNVLGNYRMQGYFQGMRIFNYLTMFSRPAIAAMDVTLEQSGLHPFRVPEFAKTKYGQAAQQAGINPRVAASLSFMTKGFVGITLPTAMLWWVNKDDEEINQVRRTRLGTRYWFFRGNDNTIVRVRRPQILGELFGASIESTLDKMYLDDPKGVSRLLEGIWDDAALNVMPQVGVIPYSLWANKKTGLGSPIIPGRDENVDPVFQGRDDATLPSRIIADKVADFSASTNLEPLRTALSPAGLDYIFGTFAGMLGRDALQGLNAAMTYKQKGYLPAKEELPITARLVSRYPSMNVKEAQEFYDRDSQVQAAAGTIKEFIQKDPTMLLDYYTHNLDRIQLIKLHDEVRQKTADMRRAIEDLKNMPEGMMSRELRDDTIKHFTTVILQHMKIANDFSRQLGKP